MELVCSKWRITALILMLWPCCTIAQTSGDIDFNVTFPPSSGGDNRVAYYVVWSQPDPAVPEYEFSCADKCFINWTQSGVEDVFVKIEWSDESSSGEYATTFNTSADDLSLSWGKLPYNSVDEWNTKARYRWMFFPQYTPDNNGLNQLGVSDYFGINIKDWSYTKGTPISSTGSTATQGTSETPSSSNSDSNGSNMNGTNTDTAEGNDSGSTSTDGGDSAAEGSAGSGHLSTIVKVVIGLVAIVVALVTVGIIFIVIRKSQHRNQLCFPSTNAEKGIDDSIGGKPELQGSVATGRGVPYDKAELPQSLQPHDGSGYVDAKELDSRVFVAELPGSQATEGSVLAEFPAASADANALKAQERELTRRMEMDEALCRLRAEQVALHDRIRVAEMQKQEANGG